MTYAKELFDYLVKASARPNFRVLRRKERKLQAQVQKEFDTQARLVSAAAGRLLKQKALEDDADDAIERALKGSDSRMIDNILDGAADAMAFGGNFRVKKSKLDQIGISFDLSNPLAIEYLQTDRPLVLAKIKETTKELIKPILIESATIGRSPQETAKLIKDNYAFSKSRSQMIAQNEIGNAYEEGNLIPMKDAEAEGYTSTKAWLTVNDDKVEATHLQNQAQGFISLDKNFTGTDDERAPASNQPRCRCTTLYEINLNQ